MAISTVNPTTGELLERFDPYDAHRIDDVVEGSFRAQKHWARLRADARARAMQPMSHLLRQRLEEYAALITLEMGKPIAQSHAEIEKCAMTLDYYVEHGPRLLDPVDLPSDGHTSGVRYLPLGVVLGVMPWNYPFWQVLRFAIPTMLAGNGVVLKHASNVPKAALKLESLMADAGLPEGLFGTVLVEGAGVLPLLRDHRIAAVSLTGSEFVGRRIAAEAGAAIKPAVLELGGSDPFLVLADADVRAAARAAATARMQNNGQSCIAAKRFIVHSRVHDEFVDELLRTLQGLKSGDPMNADTELGPMARADLRDELHQQVVKTVEQGASLAAGGIVPEGPGAFYPASLVMGVQPGMVGFDEELFGPAGVVVSGRDEQEMIELANTSRYGLGSSVWSTDVDRALELGTRLEAGMVFVNGIVHSDPRIPFGGVKASGYGRELGPQGILEFVNAQTFWTAASAQGGPGDRSHLRGVDNVSAE